MTPEEFYQRLEIAREKYLKSEITRDEYHAAYVEVLRDWQAPENKEEREKSCHLPQ